MSSYTKLKALNLQGVITPKSNVIASTYRLNLVPRACLTLEFKLAQSLSASSRFQTEQCCCSILNNMHVCCMCRCRSLCNMQMCGLELIWLYTTSWNCPCDDQMSYSYILPCPSSATNERRGTCVCVSYSLITLINSTHSCACLPAPTNTFICLKCGSRSHTCTADVALAPIFKKACLLASHSSCLDGSCANLHKQHTVYTST